MILAPGWFEFFIPLKLSQLEENKLDDTLLFFSPADF